MPSYYGTGGFKKQEFCMRGLHPMSGEHLGFQKGGKRYCKTCKLIKAKEHVYIDQAHGEYRPIGDSYYVGVYKDTGCPEVAPSCFDCPLAECQYDNPEAFLAWKRERDALEIIDLQADGYSNLEICALVKVGRITSLKARVKRGGYLWEGGSIPDDAERAMCSKELHAMTKENLLVDSRGYHRCRACQRDWAHAKKPVRVPEEGTYFKEHPEEVGRLCSRKVHELNDSNSRVGKGRIQPYCLQCKSEDGVRKYQKKVRAMNER